jgi:uncharacterized protein (UPF0332 family)
VTPEQEGILALADESLRAARLLEHDGIVRVAVSRAYYVMFYCAEVLLLDKGLSFSKHAGVIAAFGKVIAKPGILDASFHRDLIEAAELRGDSDYDYASQPDRQTCQRQIDRAARFLAATRSCLGTPPETGEGPVIEAAPR